MTLRLRLRHWLGARVRQGRNYLNEIAVIGHEDSEAQGFHAFGFGSAILAPQGVMYNTEHIALGEGVLVGPNVVLSVGAAIGQEMIERPVVRIGSRTIVGRGTHIVGHWNIEIGEDVLIGPNVYITDQNHTYQDLDRPISAQPGVEAEVSIGSGSWLATNVVILPGAKLGRNTVVAAGAVVRGEFPDYVVLAGVPARIVKHRKVQ
jgi:acetyltransferase-like isoleucine patch superfamily enzyme